MGLRAQRLCGQAAAPIVPSGKQRQRGYRMGALEGNVAIITGGTSGIGARTVERFVAEGAKVVIAGRRREEGEALARRLGPAASFIRTDVAKEAEVKAMIEHALATFGRLDCLFNNAGNPGRMTGIADVDMGHFDAIMNVHVRGVVLGMKHAAPVMSRQGSGSIINTGSVGGLRAGTSPHIYATAKAAVIHLTRCVAIELAEQGIRVNSISPGAIVTGIFAKGAGLSDGAADQTAEGLKERFARVQPLHRAGVPDDIAQAAVYLASDASGFVTGHDIVVDGGQIAGPQWSVAMAGRNELAKRFRSLAQP
jgi:NAD(P)-dependent dehydrogenase (short-subunit alcohol dehydrogenase family)